MTGHAAGGETQQTIRSSRDTVLVAHTVSQDGFVLSMASFAEHVLFAMGSRYGVFTTRFDDT